MESKESGSQTSNKRRPDWSIHGFASILCFNPILLSRERLGGDLRATARTAWHTHPLGQTLIVTAGGRARRWGPD